MTGGATTADSHKTGDWPNLFGTSGIRGVAGQDLSWSFCNTVGRAIGTALAPHCQVCIATDTRVSRDTVKDAVASGLLSCGVDVTDLGILPTPALALLTREMGFDTGVMITASHNPADYNGIKLFNGDATGYAEGQELHISRVYFDRSFAAGSGVLRRENGLRHRYLSAIEDKVSRSAINRRMRLVVDPGNGAASGFASNIFASLGLDVIPLNDEPDGRFPGRSPEPRADTLGGSIGFLQQHGADLAICFDGDADRVVFCDREGFLGFNEMIAFIARAMVEKTGKAKVATTVETGRLLELALRDIGGEVVRGRVGDVPVAHLARELDAALGVEQVGVYIFPELGYYPDSILAALTLLSHLDYPGQIREFFQALPPLYFEKAKLPCPNELKESVMARLRTGVQLQRLTPLTGGSWGWLNTADGLRFEFPDSWVLIRPSGTEPVIRIIAESGSKKQTDELIEKGMEMVQHSSGLSK